MYLREKRLKLFKVKNVIMTVLAVVILVISVFDILNLISSYQDDWYTILHAKSTPGSIIGIIFSVLALTEMGLSRRMIHEATFYSSYFEGSLDGYIRFEELASVTGCSLKTVAKKIRIYLRLYMKDFEVRRNNGGNQIELYSKRTLCECKNCGAAIDKRVYFTGTCGYCGSSDLHAKILAGNRFYSISHDVKLGTNRSSYYKNKHNSTKQVVFIILAALAATVAIIMTCYSLDLASKYIDKAYLREVLLDPDSHLRSYELIKRELRGNIIFGCTIGVCLYILALRRIRRIKLIYAADNFASFFARNKTPFIPAENITKAFSRKGISQVRRTIRMGYLEHCTLEMHEDKLNVALVKKIVKDTCPSCASPIVGAVDESYVCKYCGKCIMGVIEKNDSKTIYTLQTGISQDQYFSERRTE